MENLRFAVVDVETTGGKPERARVIEIGIVLVDGVEIVGKFSSLVKVSEELSPFIVNLTGITQKILERAPAFGEIAEKIDALLDGRIFVAHNVASDYGAVGSELKRAGFAFSPEKICTLKLARKTFPGLPKYSLGELCLSLGLSEFRQHRALDDAIAAAKLLILAETRGGWPFIEEQLRGGKRPAVYPKGFDDARISKFPRSAGIVYFIGKNGPLYATAARNIRQRILEILSSPRRGPLRGMFDGIEDIRMKELGSELLAKLCLESELEQKRFPCNLAVMKRPDVGAPLPDMAIFLPGRFAEDRGVVLVRGGKVLGYTFLQEENSYSLSDILERLKFFAAAENLVPLVRSALSRRGVRVLFLPKSAQEITSENSNPDF